MSPPIAILGAGPGGLVLARLLEIANIDFVVYERNESPTQTTDTSGTLDIRSDSGQIALQEAGLLDKFKSIARYDATVKIADAKGKVYIDIQEDESDMDKPEIDRKDLRNLLLDSIPREKIHWGCKVQSVKSEMDRSLSVHLADGRAVSGFQLVVGADGAWSKVRSMVTSVKPEYVGVHYMTTNIKQDHPSYSSAVSLAGKGLYMALGDEKQLIAVKLGDGSYYVGIGIRLPESWSSDNVFLVQRPSMLRQWLLQNCFHDWPQIHTNLIRNSEGAFRVWPGYGMPISSLSWQTVPGVALVGDAAHLMPPFAGEGVNQALFDSLQLAQQIVKHGLQDLNGAVAEYESLMLPHGRDLIKRNIESAELLFAPDAPRGWLKTFAGIDVEQ